MTSGWRIQGLARLFFAQKAQSSLLNPARALHSWASSVPASGGHHHDLSTAEVQVQKRTILAHLAASFRTGSNELQDPFSIVKNELNIVSERLRQGLASDIPALQQAACYFFQLGVEGKRVRPSICLLLSSALAATPPTPDLTEEVDLSPVSAFPVQIRRRQQRIAEIAELIHVASLLHDDVIDGSETRRGKPVLHAVMGNKVAILAGDFLLARASMTLASLQNTDVVRLMSQILEDLVSGEIMQATASPDRLISMEHYLSKTYHKTASLMANSSKATAVISGGSAETCDAAFEFGRNLGLAFQVVDDILDFTATSVILGKPALSDIKGGIITCPVLFAAEEHPALNKLIQRKFKQAGDVDFAIDCVQRSSGVARSQELAENYIAKAVASIQRLPVPLTAEADSARQALVTLCSKVLHRKK